MNTNKVKYNEVTLEEVHNVRIRLAKLYDRSSSSCLTVAMNALYQMAIELTDENRVLRQEQSGPAGTRATEACK